MRLISDEAWASLGWEQFQLLIGDYLRAHFRLADVQILQTGTAGPDGGRDFELTFRNRYRRWKALVECKHHGRTLGLEKLGKYLVVVLINHAKELFVFSSSSITEPARAQFGQVAAGANIELTLVDGIHLDRELLRHPEVVRKHFPGTAVAQTRPREVPPLMVSAYVRAGEDSDPDRTARPATCKLYEDQFYIHVLLKNVSHARVELLDIAFRDRDGDIGFVTSPLQTVVGREFHPLQDATVVYACRLLSIRDRILGELEVSYRAGRRVQRQRVDLPALDFGSLRTPPLVGEAVVRFLGEDIPRIVADARQGYGRLLDVRGVSGVGKSRLLDEAAARFREAGFRTLRYDAIRQKDDVFRQLLADLAGVPLFKGTLAQATSQLASVLEVRGCASEFAPDIAAFLVDEEQGWRALYSVTEGLKYFLKNPARRAPTAIVLDNIQEVSPTALRLVVRLVDFLHSADAEVCLAIASNTEVTPKGGIEPLAELHAQLDALGDTYRTRFDVQPLSVEDARLLLVSLLSGRSASERDGHRPPRDAVVDALVQKAGTRALDLLLAVEFLEDQAVIKRRGALAWFIPSFRRFAAAIREVPSGSQALIGKRLRALEDREGTECWPTIREALRFVVAFGGRLPLAFAEDFVAPAAVDVLVDRGFLRPVSEGGVESLVASHDNIQRYLASRRPWAPTRNQAERLLAWIAERDATTRDELSAVALVNSLVGGRPPAEIIRLGARAMGRSERRSPADLREVGKRLDAHLRGATLTTDELRTYLPLRVRYGDALIHQAAMREGLEVFEDIYREMRTIASPEGPERDAFFHAYVNANLHCGRYARAVEVMEDRLRRPPTDPHYLFLLHDRYGVAHTALGDVAGAGRCLDRALDVARLYARPDLESIAHYDRAYTHVHVTFDTGAAVAAFRESLEAFERCTAPPGWRQIESHQTRALVALLEGRLDEAREEAAQARWLSGRENAVIYDVKLLNLIGVQRLLGGDPEAACRAFDEGRSKAAMSYNHRAYWRAVANRGVVAALDDDSGGAADHLAEVEQYLRDTALPERAVARELPILANYVAVCARLGETDTIDRLLETWRDARLHAFSRALRRAQRVDPPGIVRHGGFALLPT